MQQNCVKLKIKNMFTFAKISQKILIKTYFTAGNKKNKNINFMLGQLHHYSELTTLNSNDKISPIFISRLKLVNFIKNEGITPSFSSLVFLGSKKQGVVNLGGSTCGAILYVWYTKQLCQKLNSFLLNSERINALLSTIKKLEEE